MTDPTPAASLPATSPGSRPAMARGRPVHLDPVKVRHLALAFSRRTFGRALFAPNQPDAFDNAIGIKLPVAYRETRLWTEYEATELQYLAAATALALPTTEPPAPPPFTNAVHMSVAHRGELVACPPCGARGKTSCTPCAGRGRKACPRCAHLPGYKPPCTECKGYRTPHQPCHACNGKGFEDPCSECSGQRITTCLACTGAGEGDCVTCRATTKAYRCNVRIKSYEATRTLSWNAPLPTIVCNWLDGLLPIEAQANTEAEVTPPRRLLEATEASFSGHYHLVHYRRVIPTWFLETRGSYLKISRETALAVAHAHGIT